VRRLGAGGHLLVDGDDPGAVGVDVQDVLARRLDPDEGLAGEPADLVGEQVDQLALVIEQLDDDVVPSVVLEG
jgi:hypothetical protein